MEKQIYISDFDMKRFKWLINKTSEFEGMNLKHLVELKNELQNAIVVDPKNIPPDVVTMHSRFSIKDLDTNEEFEYTLVFPFDADSENKKLSILAPIGVAVIGYRIGDIIEWNVPGGKRRIQITNISYQPEAEGNYYI